MVSIAALSLGLVLVSVLPMSVIRIPSRDQKAMLHVTSLHSCKGQLLMVHVISIPMNFGVLVARRPPRRLQCHDLVTLFQSGPPAPPASTELSNY